MTIVVGYVPTPEGEAAFDQAIKEARKAQSKLVVINSSRGDALVDKRYAGETEIEGIEQRSARKASSTSSSSRCAATTPPLRSWRRRRHTRPT